MSKISNSKFVHIHVHSEYSYFDGLAPIEKMCLYCREKGFPALALTDHGNMGGVLKLIKFCGHTKDKNGKAISFDPIKPIIGTELYMSMNRKNKGEEQLGGRKGNFHITVIAKNWKGYQNLCALNDIAWEEGYYYDPRIDFEVLEKHKEGLIVTTGCPGSIVNANLINGRYDKAKEACGALQSIFGENLWGELQFHGLEIEKLLIPDLLKIFKDLGIKMVRRNDSHYCEKKQAESHDVLLCMNMKKCIADPSRMKFHYNEFYIKEAQEMMDIFKDIPDAVYNTKVIADGVDDKDIVKNLFKASRLPKVEIPPGFKDEFEYLEKLTWEGAKKFGWDTSPVHIERIKSELNDLKTARDINGLPFPSYFLLARECIKIANDELDVWTGPGRGSVYASCVRKCIGITYGPIDPIESGLVFERFLGFQDKLFFLDSDFGLEEEVDLNQINIEEEKVEEELLGETEEGIE